MKATVRWAGDARFVGESGTGHAVVMEGAPEFGGNEVGIRPMEMLLLGLGGCSAFDVVLILKKARQDIRGCVVDIEARRAEAHPRVFTHIHARFRLQGGGLDARQVERAVRLSAEKYCSASIMLGQSAEITHEWEIVAD